MHRRAQAALVLVDRAFYALQWFVLAPATAALLGSGRLSSWEAGLLPLAFIAGAAAAQLLGAEASSLIGARNAFVLGFSILSASDVAVAMSRGAAEAVALRLVAGVGVGLFFSPAGYVLVELGDDSAARLMGLYNTAFELGGAAALAWGLVDGALGWRSGTELSGLIGLALSAATLVIMSENPRPERPRSLIRSRGLEVAAVGVAGAGAFGASYALGSFLPYYASVTFVASPYGMGALTAVSFIGGALGGLIPLVLDVGSSSVTTVTLLLVSSASYSLLLARPYPVFLLMAFVNGLIVNWAVSVYYAHTVERFGRSSSTTSLAIMNALNMAASLWVYPLVAVITPSEPSSFPVVLAASSAALSPLLLLRPRRRD